MPRDLHSLIRSGRPPRRPEKDPLNLIRFVPAEGTRRMTTTSPTHRLRIPIQGAPNPGSTPNATTPASFALAAHLGRPLMFASPDTPGMPAPSEKTAWDFMPDDWLVEVNSSEAHQRPCSSAPASSPCLACE